MKSAGKLVATHLLLGVLLAVGGAHTAVANIVGEDDRQEIERLALSADERNALYDNLGKIECVDPEGISTGNGFIFDGGNRLLTSAHVIWRTGTKCTFIRKTIDQNAELDLTRASFGIAPSERTDHSQDWAIVPLKAPSNTPIFRLGTAPEKGEELLLVSVSGRGKQLDGSRLIGRRCTAVDKIAYENSQTLIGYDCDTIPGDSGAPVFSRRNGVLEFVGLHVAGTPEIQNGRPYSVWGGSGNSSVSIDGRLGVLLSGFAAAPTQRLLKPFHSLQPPLQPVVSDLNDNPFYKRINKVIRPDPGPAREEITIAGAVLRDLTPDDQLLYGIPDEIKGVVVASVSSRSPFVEGDVLLEETLEKLAKLHDQGRTSLAVSVRKLNGRTERQALPLE